MGNNETKLLARKTFLDISATSHEAIKENIDWDNLFNLETKSLENIIDLMPDNEIRLLRDTNAKNLSLLCEKAIIKLSQLAQVEILEDLKIDLLEEEFVKSQNKKFMDSTDFVEKSSSQSSSLDLARQELASRDGNDTSTNKKKNFQNFNFHPGNIELFIDPVNFPQILTILRILTRILPILYERQEVKPENLNSDSSDNDRYQNQNYDISDMTNENNESSEAKNNNNNKNRLHNPYIFDPTSLDRLDHDILFEQLKITIKKLLFLPLFTVLTDDPNNPKYPIDHTKDWLKFTKLDNNGNFEKDYYELIWAPGIGFCRDLEINEDVLLNRVEVLRVLLILILNNKFEDGDKKSLDYNLPLFSSLVNSIFSTAMSFNNDRDNASNKHLMKKYGIGLCNFLIKD